MHKNFFDDDWGYDYKRYCFVHKINAEEKIMELLIKTFSVNEEKYGEEENMRNFL